MHPAIVFALEAGYYSPLRPKSEETKSPGEFMMTTTQPRQRTKRFPVLTTKLLAPPARSDTIDRPALNQRLSEALAGRLTVISAPPGFGKTTAVVNWHPSVADQGWRLGWVSLDSGDNDLARFLTYLVYGFSVLGDDFGDDTLSVLETVQGAAAGYDWHVPVTVLLNELERNAEPVLLVLDDYHEIVEPGIHSALTYLVEHLPVTARIIITSRTDPPLSLPLLRARRELTEIGVDQLRFTNEEASAFVRDVMGLDLTADQIAELERRTEGWIAGLLLAALSVGDASNPAEVIASFGGAHHFVFDYLAEEVLHRQPAELQQFLLQTSVLDQLSADLCNAITGRDDSADVLTTLDDANLFVVRLDQSRNWYRYHHLFGEFLSSRFRRDDPDGWQQAHLRAAETYTGLRLYHQAIDHTLAINDYGRTADLIVETGMRTINAGRTATLRRWFAALPQELVTSCEDLLTIHLWTLLMERRYDEIARELARIDALEEGAGDHAGENDALVPVRVGLALLTGDLDGAIRQGEQALETLDPDDDHSRSMVTVHLGTAYRMRGNLTPAIPLLTEGMEISDRAGNTPAWLIAASQRAIAWMTLGDLRLAHDAFREVIEIEAKLGLTNLGFAIASHLGLAEVLREWDRLEEAEDVLTPALNVLQRLDDGEQFGTKLYALLILIRLRCGESDYESALEIADKAMREAGAADVSAWEYERASAFRARVLITLGRLDEALRWEQSIPPPERPLRSSREITYQVLTRLYLATDRFDEARQLIKDSRELAAASDLRRRMIELDVLGAVASLQAGQQEEAAAQLSTALASAERDDYRRVFLDDGPVLLPLFEDLRHNRPVAAEWTAEYLNGLIGAIDGAASEETDAGSEPVDQLDEPLTEREIEVLELLAEGLTNRQVADRLFLSVGTVKRHTHNIYRKLDVSSRTQAIIRGQDLRLLN